MKRIELSKDRKGLYLSTGGALLAEVLGTHAQGLELAVKFNQHAELVKALRSLAAEVPGGTLDTNTPRGRALALLAQINQEYPQ